jgi:hypothetical protein
MTEHKKGLIPTQDQASINKSNTAENNYIADITNTPMVDGQCAEVLSILRKGPILSFVLTVDYAIPEAAARVCDLRARGFNVITNIQSAIVFRGKIRKRVALYSLGNPEWPRPGFLPENNDLPPAA